MGIIKVVMDPEQRQKYINMLLELDRLPHVKEDPNAAYCPISLTSTPKELKKYMKDRQKILMDVLGSAGITAYDPESAPFSPDSDLSKQPNEIYVVDSGKIVGARYFAGHSLLPSTGQGIEAEKARVYNRISVILMDKRIRVSRMQPDRTIYLQYENFDEQQKEFVSVFEMLKQFDPGMGFNGSCPVLLGFEKDSEKVVDLEEEIYGNFPHLRYTYNGSVPIIQLRAGNPGLFYEFPPTQRTEPSDSGSN